MLSLKRNGAPFLWNGCAVLAEYANESTSNSVTAGIEKVNNEQQLIYTYLNTPKAELQDRSAIHYGTAMLCVDDSKKLTGNYYTSRSTRGSMMFRAVE